MPHKYYAGAKKAVKKGYKAYSKYKKSAAYKRHKKKARGFFEGVQDFATEYNKRASKPRRGRNKGMSYDMGGFPPY